MGSRRHISPTIVIGILVITLGSVVWLNPSLAGNIVLFWGLLLIALADVILSKRVMVFGITIILLFSAKLLQIVPMVYSNLSPELVGMGDTLNTFIRLLSAGLIIAYIIYVRKNQETISINLSNIPLPRLKETKDDKEIEHPSVYICKSTSNRSVCIGGMDRYLHTIVMGVTGSGKTSAVLEPMIWQDLKNYKNGKQLGMTIVAPDSEFPNKVKSWCQNLGIPYYAVDLDDPDSNRFNPLEGDPTTVSEIMRTVLRATFGEQEAFFAQAQELHAKNTMLLLKKLQGDDITLLDVYTALMDIESMQSKVEDYEELYGEDVLTEYFKKEAFGRNRDKLHQFAMGLRLQISDLLTNSTIQNVLVGRSDISLDRVMAEGGVLLFNTSLGKMGYMSRIFGQFLIMHIQNAVFRRPGTEFNRIPHYLYIDELPVYYNPELETLLNLGRKYRCGCVFTIQGPSQLEIGKQGQAIREKMLNGCRNKIVLGIESARDAQLISDSFGEQEEIQLRKMRKRWSVMPESYAETEMMTARFDYTKILEIKRWHGYVKMVKEGSNQVPVEGVFEPPWEFQTRIAKELGGQQRLTLAN